ncbi:MAG: glycosyltransferase 87 family protein [Corynebacterium sp.]|nr:glycosyltransferase 87 family protein [Corynebacterium sp.]
MSILHKIRSSGEPVFYFDELLRSSDSRDRIFLLAPVLLSLLCLILGFANITNYCLFGEGMDLEIFRFAGEQLKQNASLYSGFTEETGLGLAYIYPPFAAIVFIPLTWLPLRDIITIWTLLTVVVVFTVLFLVTRRLAPQRSKVYALVLSCLFLGPALLFEPIAANIYYAQIDIFLFLLVALDVLDFLPRPLRGLGIGLAAAIKVTPASFAVIFLARRDWYAVAVSAGTFLFLALIGYAVVPAQSVEFWTDVAWDTTRAGAFDYWLNQSISAFLSTAGVENAAIPRIMTWVLVVFAVIAIWAAWKFALADRSVSALAFVLLSVLLSTPISVTHHWAGMVIAIPMLFMFKDRMLTYGLCLFVFCGILVGINNHSGFEENFGDFVYENPWFILRSIGIFGIALYLQFLAAAIRIAPTKLKNHEDS